MLCLLQPPMLNRGPEGTPFEFGVFRAVLKFPRDYPHSPPKMKFTSRLFHPNGIIFLILAFMPVYSIPFTVTRYSGWGFQKRL